VGPVFHYLLLATANTVVMSASCIAGAFLGGVGLGILAAVGPRAIGLLVSGLVLVVRGTPVLIQIFIVFYGLPLLGVHPSDGLVVFVAISAYGAVLIAEILRGAFASLPPGQTEAARALGMRRLQIVWFVLLPQTLRYALAPAISLVPVLIKATSYGSLIGFSELTSASHEMAAKTLQVLPVFGVTFCLYFALCFPISRLAQRLEQRLVSQPS
jgi:polar amino acid transport system permease protein